MPLKLHNTLTRRKSAFTPIDPERVRLYVCGPTVYDDIHIGNARPLVVFDVLYRLLRTIHGRDHVRYVRNITDVDDKIIARARETGIAIDELTERTVARFHEDTAALGCLDPDVEPRATDHIAAMQGMIGKLLASNHAYVADGHVVFHVPSSRDYGRLSGRNRDEMIAGARVEVAPYKRDPADFVLWKPSSAAEPGWDSPWGRGRPGWHIECSAMSEVHLGETFDIHGGGADLVFPHHENEIVQSVAAHGGKPFVRFWVHNGWVMSEGEKMSKSLGNFYTVRDLLDEFPGEALRWVLLATHYRQPLDFTRDALRQARETLDRFYGALRVVAHMRPVEWVATQPVRTALEDDLNTPLALSRLHEALAFLNKAAGPEAQALAKGRLLAAAAPLGLLAADPESWFRWLPAAGVAVDEALIEDMIRRREEARVSRDFSAADRIRDDLAARGVVLEDRAGGTIWRRSG